MLIAAAAAVLENDIYSSGTKRSQKEVLITNWGKEKDIIVVSFSVETILAYLQYINTVIDYARSSNRIKCDFEYLSRNIKAKLVKFQSLAYWFW